MTTPDDAGAAADQAHSPAMVRADLLTAIVFIVLAAAMLYGSWTMDRLEVRRIHPMTIPGLVPGMLSLGLTLCGVILSVRSLRQKAEGGWQQLQGALLSSAAGRALVVMGLALVYTLVLIGNMPFWAATGLFVFAFILVFECWLAEPRRPLLTSGLWALGLAIATSGIVTLVFERAFLVRLP